MKKHLGKVFIVLGIFCVLAAAALIWHNIKENREAGEASAAALDGVLAQIPSEVLKDRGDMPMVDVDGRTFVGILEIPSLGLTLPVQSEWSKENARVSICRYKGAVSTNDLILAGHNYQEHLGTLKNINTGAEMIFTDMNGRSYYYEVTYMETLGSGDVDAMDEGDWDLTVFTCTIGGASRVTVRSEYTGKCSATGEMPDIRKAVKESEHVRQ
ncbi:sortase [Lachnospiraceae bacterium C1.1]|nr:sortase [Lachnospiraceae bacterium C1.1]